MTSRPKPRRRKQVEPLDWRELADGPALRGLAEVLSTPPEIARERTAKRAEVEAQATTARPPEGGTPSVGLTPEAGEMRASLGAEGAVGVSPSEGLSATGGDTPTVVEPAIDATAGVTPMEGDGPTEPVLPSEVASPAEGVTPSEDVAPTVNGSAWWVNAAGARYEGKRVQRVLAAQHSMSLGEERVYQTLWHGRETDGVYFESEKSKTFSLGYDRIARLVRLNEKSVRVLLPKLIHKKILEVVAAENSANQIGRTYRIFDGEEILRRQRAANLTNVVKNGRAIEFVWPEEWCGG